MLGSLLRDMAQRARTHVKPAELNAEQRSVIFWIFDTAVANFLPRQLFTWPLNHLPRQALQFH